ncbi:MAG: aminoglycoside phosphotransferase family protein [Anaerolineales bacterium]
MLEKPNYPDEKIVACLQAEFGLRTVDFAFLPLGGDLDSAVYRSVSADGTAYFCKLRRGEFDPTTVTLPRWMSEQGLRQIIAPLRNLSGQLWALLDEFHLMLYPFVPGENGYDVELSESQWADFGAALNRIHTLPLPPELRRGIAREDYSPLWRGRCRKILQRLEDETLDDPVMAELAALLRSQREPILDGIVRAEELARDMPALALESVLCHGDIQPANLHIDASGAVFIVDWDYPILAPKERDLMFIGGGQGFKPGVAEREELLFYRGYGPSRPHPLALTYYRYERAITDLAVEAERVLSPVLSTSERAQSLQYIKWFFLPGATLEVARQSDPAR